MFGQAPSNGQWNAQGGYSRPPYNSSPESQTQVNSWPSQPPSTTAVPLQSQTWSRPNSGVPNVAPSRGQTWPNTSVMPPRTRDASYQSPLSQNRPTELLPNTTFSGQPNSFDSWSQPTPLLNRKRPLPMEEGDSQNDNFSRPRSGPWPRPDVRSDDWSKPDTRSDDWHGSDGRADNWSKPTPLSDTWSRPTPPSITRSKQSASRADNWSKPNADRPPWSKPNSDTWSKPNSDTWSKANSDTWSKPNSDTWSKPNSDTWSKPNFDTWSKPNSDTWSKPNSDRPPWPKQNPDALSNKLGSNAWQRSEPRTRFTQKPFSKFGRPESSNTQGGKQTTSKPKNKSAALDTQSVFSSIITTYYVNQEKVNMPKELTSQFEPLKCGLCGVLVNSTVTAKTHYSGKMHDKKVVQFMQKWCAEKGQPLPEQFKEGVSRKQIIGQVNEVCTLYCSACDIPLASKQHAEQHYMGKAHKKALDAGGVKKPIGIPVPAEKPDPSGRFNIGVAFSTNTDPLGLKESDTPVVEGSVLATTNPFVCLLCSVCTTSKDQLDIHFGGARHRKKIGAAAANAPAADKQKIPPPAAQSDTILATVAQRPKPVVRSENQDIGLPDDVKQDFSIFRTPSGQFYCATCNVTMNSESQFGQHNDSKRHKLAAANKGKNVSTGTGTGTIGSGTGTIGSGTGTSTIGSGTAKPALKTV